MAKIDVSFQIEVDEELLRENNISLPEVADSFFLEIKDKNNSITLNTDIKIKGLIKNITKNEHFDVPLICLKEIKNIDRSNSEGLINNKDIDSIQSLIDAKYALYDFIFTLAFRKYDGQPSIKL